MKLLICTQRIDREDAVLGFFHGWLHEFSKHCKQVTVVCLYEGTHSLPRNVQVFSLGKEEGGKFKILRYIVRFYQYIFERQNDYDAVFVHMNPEYVVLGGILWRLWGKKIGLWYNHKKGGIRARIAVLLSHTVFYVSPFAFMARFRKAKQMGAGIDTERFKPKDSNLQPPTSNLQILSLGRISPVKNVDIIVQAFILLDKKGIPFRASIYGDPTEADFEYYTKVRKMAHPLVEKEIITFHKGVSHHETPGIYNEHDIFINMTPSGSFDKTILEAMACETTVLTCNKSFTDVLPKEYMVEEGSSTDLAEKIAHALVLSEKKKKELGKRLRSAAVSRHSLSSVIEDIAQYL